MTNFFKEINNKNLFLISLIKKKCKNKIFSKFN